MIFFKRFPIFLLIGEQVISIPEVHLNPCNHEEADTRIVIHVQDAVQRGATNILVRTVDTDVVIILISCFSILINIQPSLQIVVAFGMGRSFQTLSVNTIYNNLGEHKSRALPFFHAFSGCDTTSAFHGVGKKTAWEAWNSYQDVIDAFVHIYNHPFVPIVLSSPEFQLLERFTVVMYDKSSSTESVNVARRELFTKKQRTLEKIPPTQVRNYAFHHLKCS